MSQELTPYVDMATIGQIANQYAAQTAFNDYQQRLAAQTLRRQKNDLTLFSTYLAKAGVVIDANDLLSTPDAWSGVSYGLVAGFVRWLLQEGYAIGSINVRLATIKAYCKIVSQAGVLSSEQYGLIALVKGYTHKEGRNLDTKREPTRKEKSKKAASISISKEQAKQLKNQPDTPQGRRDALLMCLLLDHGLRCGELAALKPEHITNGTLTFYREKVDKTQIHMLTPDTLQAYTRYLETYTPEERLLAGSDKVGRLAGRMSNRAITRRVLVLGKRIGLPDLSAHDCRHYWATSAVRGGTDIKSLQDAGGWNSPVMPLRYAESGAIANQGVKLG